MKKRGFTLPITLVEVLVIIAIVVTVFGLMAPAVRGIIAAYNRGNQSGAQANVPAQAAIPVPLDGSWYLITVVHDGHWFIIRRHGGDTPFIHHPDCPCTKKPEAEIVQ